MSGIGTSVGGLRSTPWQRPKSTAFWLLAVMYGLLLFSASAPTPLYGVYQAAWHFSPVMLTIVFGIYGLGVLTALVLFGALSDRIGRRPVLAAACHLDAPSWPVFRFVHGERIGRGQIRCRHSLSAR
jgi:MFS family permease